MYNPPTLLSTIAHAYIDHYVQQILLIMQKVIKPKQTGSKIIVVIHELIETYKKSGRILEITIPTTNSFEAFVFTLFQHKLRTR